MTLNMRNHVMIGGATHALDSCISHLTPPPPVIYMWSRCQSFNFSKSTSSRPPVIYFRSQSYSFMWLAPLSNWVLSHSAHFTMRRFVYVYVCVFCVHLFHAAYLSCCHGEVDRWDWGLILRNLFFQCFDTVVRVIWPIKTHPPPLRWTTSELWWLSGG